VHSSTMLAIWFAALSRHGIFHAKASAGTARFATSRWYIGVVDSMVLPVPSSEMRSASSMRVAAVRMPVSPA